MQFSKSKWWLEHILIIDWDLVSVYSDIFVLGNCAPKTSREDKGSSSTSNGFGIFEHKLLAIGFHLVKTSVLPAQTEVQMLFVQPQDALPLYRGGVHRRSSWAYWGAGPQQMPHKHAVIGRSIKRRNVNEGALWGKTSGPLNYPSVIVNSDRAAARAGEGRRFTLSQEEICSQSCSWQINKAQETEQHSYRWNYNMNDDRKVHQSGWALKSNMVFVFFLLITQ